MRGIYKIAFCYFRPGLSGDQFQFNFAGDGPARYNIIHFKQVRPGDFRWVTVGYFHDGDIKLDMDGKPSQAGVILGDGAAISRQAIKPGD